MVGIYKITNPKGKSYIGLSREIEVRWNSYRNMQFQSTNSKFRESLEEYGYENHTFEVLEEVELSKDTYGKNTALLRKRERYWIKTLDTYYNGLNSNGGGSGCGQHTPSSKRKISEALKGKPKPKDFGANRKKWQHTEEFREMLKNKSGKPVIITSIDGKITKEFNNQIQAAKWVGVSPPVLQLILRKKPQRNGTIPTSTKGYKINYKEL
jgi:group I intron endonuclease